MIELTILCDGAPNLGFGHIRRSLSVWETAINQGINANIVGLSEHARSCLPKTNGEVADKIILDTPLDCSAQLYHYRSLGKRIASLDHQGNCCPNLVINVFNHCPPVFPDITKVGLEYCIIREEFRKQKNAFIPDHKRATIMIGGGDILDMSEEAAKCLNDKGMWGTIIKGPFSKNSSSKIGSFDIINNPNNIAEIIQKSSHMVTNGGGSLFEALYLNKEIWVIPQTTAEKRIAEHISEKYICGINLHDLQVSEMDLVSSNIEPGEELVDGRGCERILELAMNL